MSGKRRKQTHANTHGLAQTQAQKCRQAGKVTVVQGCVREANGVAGGIDGRGASLINIEFLTNS